MGTIRDSLHAVSPRMEPLVPSTGAALIKITAPLFHMKGTPRTGWLFFFAAIVMTLTLFGCGGDKQGDAQSALGEMQARLDQLEKRIFDHETRPQEKPETKEQLMAVQQTLEELQQTLTALRQEQAELAKRMESYEKQAVKASEPAKEQAPTAKKASPGETGPRSYTVKPGDTLYRIATDNKLTVEELRRLNNMTGNAIKPGQKLIVAPPK